MAHDDLILRLRQLGAKVGTLDRPLINDVIAQLQDYRRINQHLWQNNRDMAAIVSAAHNCRDAMQGELHGAFLELEDALDGKGAG